MISEESGPSLVSFGPVPDLTGSVIKLDDQYSEGGSFGDVYRCKYLSNSGTKEVAVKAFRFEFTVNEHDGNGSDRSSRMIRRELGIWRRLDHENIVPFLGIVYGFGRLRTASLVSLWMPHGTLHNLIAKHHDKLTNSRRLQLLLDVANGLLYLHSFPIIHGDLSSNNVLIDANYNARLTDFGYASLLGEIPEALAYLQMSTRRPGTLRWAAPEQLFPGPEDTLERRTKSDIYSFGSIALEVFSGELPWSEVRGDAAVIVLVSEGQKPSRPQSYPINDQHWEFIERCWSEVLERPAAKDIVSALGHFRASLLVDLLRLSAKFTDSQPASSGSPSPSASRAQLLEVYQEVNFAPEVVIPETGRPPSPLLTVTQGICRALPKAPAKPEVIPNTVRFPSPLLTVFEGQQGSQNGALDRRHLRTEEETFSVFDVSTSYINEPISRERRREGDDSRPQ